MENYTDKIYAIIALQQRGYDLDFMVKDGRLFCLQRQELMNASEFEVAESYQFKGEKGDFDMIYGIRSMQMDFKGILMASCKQKPGFESCKLTEILEIQN